MRVRCRVLWGLAAGSGAGEVCCGGWGAPADLSLQKPPFPACRWSALSLSCRTPGSTRSPTGSSTGRRTSRMANTARWAAGLLPGLPSPRARDRGLSLAGEGTVTLRMARGAFILSGEEQQKP